MSRYPKLLTELVGTFIFFTVIALSGSAGALAPLARGGFLLCMFFRGAHISGPHNTPAVSFAVFLRGKIDVTDLISYWLVQMVGGSLGNIFGYLVGGHTARVHPGKGVYASTAVALEILLRAALALVVLNLAASTATSCNSRYRPCIGLNVAAA